MSSKLTVERVLERPSPEQWAEDELMTLAEAARLHWPKGPLTEETLRTAVRDGRLPVSEIARKLFVTRAALRELNVCRSRPAPASPDDPRDDEGDLDVLFEAMERGPRQASRSRVRRWRSPSTKSS